MDLESIDNSQADKTLGVWGASLGEIVPLYQQREPQLLYLVKALAVGQLDHIRPFCRIPGKGRMYDGINDEIGDNPEEWILKQEADILERLRDDYKRDRYLLECPEHGEILSDFTPSYYRIQEKSLMESLIVICMNPIKFLRWAMDRDYENALPPMIKKWLREQEKAREKAGWQSLQGLTITTVSPEEVKAYEDAIGAVSGSGNKKKLRAVLLAAQGMKNPELEIALPLEGSANVSRYKAEGRTLAISKGLPPIWGRGEGVPPPNLFLGNTIV